MKNKRILLTLLLGIIFSSAAMSQKMNIGISGGPMFPIGDGSDAYDTGFGFDGSFDYYPSDKFNVGLEAGYKPFSSEFGDLDVVPILLTAAYHNDIGTTTDLYAELGGGIYSVSNGESETYGGVSPRIGLAFELTPDLLFLDSNVSYNTILVDEGDNFNWVGVNVGLLYTIN